MIDHENPFEYDAAIHLPKELILDIFVEEFNFTRFIKSHRNVYLHGERGSGKSITLLFNSVVVECLKAKRENSEPDLSDIGIYISCNSPISHDRNHEFLDNDFQRNVVSEHFLSLQITDSLTESLSAIPNLFEGVDEAQLIGDLEYILADQLPSDRPFLEAIGSYAQREVRAGQQKLQADSPDIFYENASTFSSLVEPLISLLGNIPRLRDSHFLLMFDDAHNLNSHQRHALNSWIAYRDNRLYSFKVAAVQTPEWDYLTFQGGTIVEGHDFIRIDLEEPYQSPATPFGKLAREIVGRRLRLRNIETAPDDFFPISEQLERDLVEAKSIAEAEAEEKFPDGTTKQRHDYVYKYARARYFRDRSPRANIPPYSGFDTLVHISTGVVRNLLEPCYWMWDRMRSEAELSESNDATISKIPPRVQTDVIKEKSEALWDKLELGLDKSVEHCSPEQAQRIKSLFDNLAILFRERLLSDASEPRVLQFSISGMDDELRAEIVPLLEIARRAQLLYVRYGPAKDKGRREPYYVPNRMLWPIRGLDPHGQHGRVSLKAKDILAASLGTPFNPPKGDNSQESLFIE